MSRRIILERPLNAGCWRTVGQVAKAGKRAELLPVLIRVQETGGTNAQDLAGHLFFESRSRRVVAERLLRIGAAYGLLDEDNHAFTLTEAGKEAIDTGEVFVPEDGAWTIWASDDPALPSPVLRIEPWNESTAYDEIKGMQRENARKRRGETLPAWLRNIIGTPVIPAVGGVAAVRIDHLDDNAEAVDTHGALRLRWNVGDGRLQLDGRLAGRQEGKTKQVETELEAPCVPPEEIWRTLLESEDLQEQWDEERQVLRVPFDETDHTEREAMSRDLKFESPYLPRYGTFDPLTVPGVGITAESEMDAQSWAKWRLRVRIRDYATSRRYTDWCAEAAAPFDRYKIELPARGHLAREFWEQVTDRPEPRAWYLVAAEDWSL